MLYPLLMLGVSLGLTALSFFLLYQVIRRAVKAAILESWQYWPGPSAQR